MMSAPPPQGGTQVRGITTTQGPASGRGIPLSDAEEKQLIDVCLAHKGAERLSAHKKSFWMQVASAFADTADRTYSWQSCRRRMIAWELEHDRQSPPAPSAIPPQSYVRRPFVAPGAESPSSPLARPSNVPSNVRRVADSTGEDETDDDLLPRTPVAPLRRDHFKCELKQTSLRGDVCTLVMNGMDSFESQLQCFATALIEQPDEREGIYGAFDKLKFEVQKAVENYVRRHDEA
ncbi:uncharacterized protein N7459_004482 [Penicillium hispanicum]|uniref:uncharacterized protein n=1 Tax=Penicillium hispanicum TaxID=1080232 RepID=UPI002540CC7A|nr:uncharacterized protein N7459_004482 [Penicillium hispanicum]KAJ5584682.1 hypothetical protein N7459_004482 [Penicillium hispanicum]